MGLPKYGTTGKNTQGYYTTKRLIRYIMYYGVQVLYATPNQDGFYDITDALEEQGMEQIIKVKHQPLISFLLFDV